METHQIQSLLDQTSSIVNQYEKIAEITGEKFNIFKILSLETKEVGTHSAFIAELLNPNGSHKKGNLFLNDFLVILNNKKNNTFKEHICESSTEITLDTEQRISVETERWLGKIKENEGGFIDILITDQKGKKIIIENKIDARDQPNQLCRYHDFDTTAPIVYLTLNGENPLELSTNNKQSVLDKLICLSYKTDILEWMESCRKLSVNHPILRETITQYIYLIKHLTNQTINNKMAEEIVATITKSGNNISAAIELSNSITTAKQLLLKKFAKNLEEKVLQSEQSIRINIAENFGYKWQGMTFKLPKQDKQYIFLSFEFDFSGFYIEIANTDNNEGKNKNPENIDYYQQRLRGFRDLGNVAKAENRWHGDWFCSYKKLNKLFEGSIFWRDLANNDFSITEKVGDDIIELLKILKEKLQNKPNV